MTSGRALPAKLTSPGRALVRRELTAVGQAEDRLLARVNQSQRGEVRAILVALGSATPDEAARGM